MAHHFFQGFSCTGQVRKADALGRPLLHIGKRCEPHEGLLEGAQLNTKLLKLLDDGKVLRIHRGHVLVPCLLPENRIRLLIDLLEGHVHPSFHRPFSEQSPAERMDCPGEAALHRGEGLG